MSSQNEEGSAWKDTIATVATSAIHTSLTKLPKRPGCAIATTIIVAELAFVISLTFYSYVLSCQKSVNIIDGAWSNTQSQSLTGFSFKPYEQTFQAPNYICASFVRSQSDNISDAGLGQFDEPCVLEGLDCKDYDDKRCPEAFLEYFKSDDCTDFPDCSKVALDGLVSTVQISCPSFVSALGASLAYITYVQLALLAICLSVYLLCYQNIDIEKVADEVKGVVTGIKEDIDTSLILPEGWKATKDPETGTIYYVNEIDGTSSWERPSMPRQNQMTQQPARLSSPKGWTKHVDETTGRPYYVNDTDGTPSWNMPTEKVKQQKPPAQQQKSPITAGWTKHVDETTGKPFYTNNIDGTTSWDIPTTTPKQPAQQKLSPLPAGWTQHVDKTTGKPYYINSTEGTTSWDRPSQPQSQELPPLPAGWTQHVDEATGKPYYTDVDGTTSWDRPSQPKQHPQSQELPPLPAGWTQHVDEATGKSYYTDTDGTTSWDRPSQPQPQQQPQAHQSLRSSTTKAPDIPQEVHLIAPLPQGWVEITDPSGKQYYYNKEDDMTSWERPSAGTAIADVHASATDGL